MDAGTIAVLLKLQDEMSGPMRQAARSIDDVKGPSTQAAAALNSVQKEAGQAAKALDAVDAPAQQAAQGMSILKASFLGFTLGSAIQQAPQMIKGLASSTFMAASDMVENTNKVRVVFGQAAGEIESFAKGAAQNLGMSRSAALQATGTFGNLFVSMGMGVPAASEMSQGIVQLAADLASFNNIPVEDAIDKLRAGLVGETEPLRALGVNLSAAAVESKALEMGLASTASALTPAMKAQASYALILEQTRTAQGDFARNSDEAANSMKTLGAMMSDAAARTGAFLLVVGTPALAFAAENFHAIGAAIVTVLLVALYAATPAMVAFATATWAAMAPFLPFIAAAAALGAAVFLLVKYWDPLIERFPIVGVAVDKVREAFRLLVDFVGGAIPGFLSIVGGVAIALVEWFTLPLEVIAGLGKSLWKLFTGDFEGAWNAAKGTVAGIGASFSNMKDGVQQAMSGVVQAVEGGWDAATSAAPTPDEFIGPLMLFGPTMAQMTELTRRGKGELTEFANSSEMVSVAVARANQNLAYMGEASRLAIQGQQNLNTAWDTATGAVSFWETQLSNATTALDYLNEQAEKNGGLTADQQRQYDILTQASARYKGGIEDESAAVVNAAVAQAEFIARQDELNGLLAAGKMEPAEYARAMADLTAETDPAASAAFNMAGAQGDLAAAIDGTVNKLGNLLIDLGLLPESKRTEFSTPGADDAQREMDELKEKADRVPTSMTITAYVDLTAAQNALNELRGMTFTQSPPKEGPMAFQPDFGYIFETLVPAAEQYGEEALAHVKSFVESAQAAFEAMNAQLDVGERLQAGVPLPTTAQLDELKARSEYALSIIVGVAERYSEEGLAAAKRFSDAGKAIFDLFGSVADLLSGDATFIITDEQISRMKFAIEHAVRSIQDTAAMFESDGMAAATEFSAAGLAVAEMLSAVRDAFGSTDEFSIMDDASISRMKFAIEHAVQSIRDTAAMFDEDGLAAATSFSQSAEAVAEMLSAVRDAFSFTDDFQIIDNATISRLKFAVEHAVQSIRDTALYLGSDGLEETQAFSAAASAVVGLIGDAVDAFVALSELEQGDTNPNANIDAVVTLARNIVTAVELAAATFSTEGLAAAQQFSDAGGAVMGLVTNAVDAYTALTGTTIDTDVTDAARDIVAMSQTVVAAVVEAASYFETEGLSAAGNFASAGGAALDLVRGVGDSIEAILTFGSEKKRDQIAKLAPSMVTFAEMVTEAVSEAASQWDEEGLAAVELFASSAGQAVSLMADIAAAYEAMAGMSKITQKHVDVFTGNWQVILDMIPRLVEMSEPYLDDAEKFREIAEMIAAEFAAAAEAIGTVAGDAAKTVSGAAKGANMAVGFFGGGTAVDDIAVPGAGSGSSGSRRGGLLADGMNNPGFNSLDRNGDGIISAAELAAAGVPDGYRWGLPDLPPSLPPAPPPAPLPRSADRSRTLSDADVDAIAKAVERGSERGSERGAQSGTARGFTGWQIPVGR